MSDIEGKAAREAVSECWAQSEFQVGGWSDPAQNQGRLIRILTSEERSG
jgi:hypothetical protein